MGDLVPAVLGMGAVIACCALAPALLAGVSGVALVAFAGVGGAIVAAVILGALMLRRRSNSGRSGA